MTTDYIPGNDAEFTMWSTAFVNSVKVAQEAYNLTEDEVTALETSANAWESSYTDMFSKRDAARAATVGKDNMRETFEGLLRSISQKIQSDPNVSEELKVDAGLPHRSSSRSPVPVPTSTPIAEIEACNIQEHRLMFTDSLEVHRRRRPHGVFGVEIYAFVGDSAPTSNDQFEMKATVTRMKATFNFTNEQAGKVCYYRFRYINTRGEVGPWSMIYNASILK